MKKLILMAAVAGLLAMAALPAQAHTGPAQYLNVQGYDTGSGQWQRHSADSPLDTGRARLKLAVAEQTGNDYVVARAEHTGIVGKGVARVRNLSFDVLTSTYVGAGSPRISVEVDTTGDGDADVYAYLAAFHCTEAIPGSNWARADFTGRISAGCDLYASDQAGPYASTGTQSAWAVFAAAHPGATVIDAYVVADEVGQSYIDNLAFQRHVFTGKGRMAECTTEASC